MKPAILSRLVLPTVVLLQIAGLSGPMTATAQPPAPDPAKKKEAPQVESLGDNRYRMGEVEFNGKTREIRIPTVVNMEEGLLEFALVHETGKTHESLLATKVLPSQMGVVLKLCRYQDGEGDVFDVMLPDNEKKGAAGAKERGDSVSLTVEWTEGGEKKSGPITDWVKDLATGESMKDGTWVFSGSYNNGDGLVADFDGTHIGIYLYRGAMLNQMREGADDDERWVAFPEKTPDLGTEVTLVIRPAEKK